MSETSNASGHDAAHIDPNQNKKQLLATVALAFVVPVLIIIALISFLTSSNRPAADTVDAERAVAGRIQKIGLVEFQGGDRVLKTGEQVFKAQCYACHLTGAAGSPKFGDAAAWGPRIKTGFDALWNSALKGKGNMGAQGGGDLSDLEVARGVVYMANAGGAKFEEPKAPAAAAAPAK